MDVRENRLRDVLGGEQRYRVPLYQRPYSWGEKQLARLWSDVTEVAGRLPDNDLASHFTGSLVLDLASAGPGAQEFLVVDGQQRLTSLSVLLCAIRDHFGEHEPEHPQKRDQVHEKYIIDRYGLGDARLKLLPTQADRADYRAIVDGALAFDSASAVSTAYRFFRLQLQLADDPDDPHDIDRILEAVLGGLAFVSITARGEDNVYRIFESLNNTGMKLTQGDLLRNYLFMRLGSRGDEVYTSWWLPMQQRLTQSDLEALFWLDLVVLDSEVKQGDIYDAQHRRMERLTADQVLEEVKRYSRLSKLLAIIRDPSLESSSTVRFRLARLKQWGAIAADPLVLHLMAQRDSEAISSEHLATCLSILESFLVRRLLIGASSGGLSRILLRAPSDMRTDRSVADALLLYLSTGRKFFATDDQVREAVRTKPLYFMGKASQKKTLLQWLEESYGSKEPTDLGAATIEHVLPQTMTPWWRDALKVDAAPDESSEAIHEQLVHTLGNLTLTAYNSELSNRSFDEKRSELQRSGIRLNLAIAAEPRWGRPEILARADELSTRLIAGWVPPVESTEVIESGVTWTLVAEAVQAIPPGRWTSYGDLAVLASTYAQPVAAFVSREPLVGAWRVLQAAGTIAGGFHWSPGSPQEGKAPREVLISEGLVFDDNGRADPAQRIRPGELAHLLGMELGDEDAVDEPDSERMEAFLSQLSEKASPTIVHGVRDLMESWRGLGGALDFGRQGEVSCFLIARQENRGLGLQSLWPITFYPKSGTAEIVFQYMKDRPPFDSTDLRRQLLDNLNGVPGIELDEKKLELRPSFALSVLANSADRAAVLDVLQWFFEVVRAHDAELADAAR